MKVYLYFCTSLLLLARVKNELKYLPDEFVWSGKKPRIILTNVLA